MSEMNHCGCLTMSEIRARTLRDAARELRLMAAEEFEDRTLTDARGAAIWDCAAWLEEEAGK